MTARAADAAIVLGGRRFRRVTHGSLEHDNELLRLLRLAGIRETATPAAADEIAWGAIERLLETKTMLPLLGCLIVPERAAARREAPLAALWRSLMGQRPPRAAPEWSPEIQAETAAFLGALDDPADKERVYQIISDLLFPFLSAGVLSWLRSPLSSAGAAAAPASPNGVKSSSEASAHGAR